MYDYANNGAYFVTVCTHDKKHLFGAVADGEMLVNGAGKMIEGWWKKLPEKFPGISIDEYVIMPNHFHGIIIIEKPIHFPVGAPLVGARILDLKSDEQQNREGQPQGVGGQPQGIGGQPQGIAPTVGDIVGAFKSLTTNEYIRRVKMGEFPRFEKAMWQRNYWDRVIRNEREMRNVREYIAGNPKEWERDEYWGGG